MNDCAIRWACENNHPLVVELLLQKGANVNIFNGYLLRRATQHNYYEIIDLINQHVKSFH